MNSEFGSYTEMRPLKLGNNFFPHTLVNRLICIQLLEPFEILSGCKKQSKASILFFSRGLRRIETLSRLLLRGTRGCRLLGGFPDGDGVQQSGRADSGLSPIVCPDRKHLF